MEEEDTVLSCDGATFSTKEWNLARYELETLQGRLQGGNILIKDLPNLVDKICRILKCQ